jgi:2'-5' RNA ligase
VTLEHHYEQLWRRAVESFQAGTVEIDPLLASGQADRRRGLTVIIRPDCDLAEKFSSVAQKLARWEPGQYFYPLSDYHVTLLSLFTATENHEPFFARTPAYVEAVDEALRDGARFDIHFRGLTASANAVMIQGFPRDGTLERLRERVRERLRQVGLGQALDGRYRLQTAHVTIIRFRCPPRHLPQFLEELNSFRAHEFGVTRVEELQLVDNDWYLSAERVKVVKRYPLRGCDS